MKIWIDNIGEYAPEGCICCKSLNNALSFIDKYEHETIGENYEELFDFLDTNNITCKIPRNRIDRSELDNMMLLYDEMDERKLEEPIIYVKPKKKRNRKKSKNKIIQDNKSEQYEIDKKRINEIIKSNNLIYILLNMRGDLL